jgi:hypothetical protein
MPDAGALGGQPSVPVRPGEGATHLPTPLRGELGHPKSQPWPQTAASQPPPMVPLGVKYPKDDYALAFDAVKELIGETSRERSAQVAVVRRGSSRLIFEQNDCPSYLIQELIAQTWASAFVPLTSFPQVRFRAGPEDDRPSHEVAGLRIRASTSRQGEPAVGSCS